MTKKTGAKPFFSLIIPTLNEEKWLPHLLKDLLAQTWSDFEVVHVDGDSTDKTLAKAKKFAAALHIQTISTKRRNVAYQRNLGGKAARGTWLIFLDADNRLPKYFLQGVKYRLELAESKGRPIDVFTTLVHLSPSEPARSLNKTAVNFINLALKAAENTDRPEALGAMIGMNREVFTQIKFKTQNKVMEDCLLAEAAKKQGYHFRVLTDPTYAYSLRRLHTKGFIRTAVSGVHLQVRRLLGRDFSQENCGYDMPGGGAYDCPEK